MSYIITMKYLLYTILLGFSLTSSAQDAPKTPKSQEKKGPPKEFLEKYDTNKDGKVDKEERSKVSQEDKRKFAPQRAKGASSPSPSPSQKRLIKNPQS
jgi:hypothetical protein